MLRESFDRGRRRGRKGVVCGASGMGGPWKAEGGDDGGARPRMGLLMEKEEG